MNSKFLMNLSISASLSRWLVDNLDLDKARKQKLALTGKFIWGIVNNIPLLHNAVLRYLYISYYHFYFYYF